MHHQNKWFEKIADCKCGPTVLCPSLYQHKRIGFPYKKKYIQYLITMLNIAIYFYDLLVKSASKSKLNTKDKARLVW